MNKVTLVRRLATLLEGAGYFFNITSIQKYILTLLWLKKCVVTNVVPTIKLWRKNEEKVLNKLGFVIRKLYSEDYSLV